MPRQRIINVQYIAADYGDYYVGVSLKRKTEHQSFGITKDALPQRNMQSQVSMA